MKKLNARNTVIVISLFYITLLFQSLIPLNNFVEILLLVNIFINRKHINLLFQERFLIVCFAVSGTVSYFLHADPSFFTYWHYCIVMPILLYISGKSIKDEKDLKKIIYAISFVCLIILTISIISTPLNVEIKEGNWSDEHTRMFWLFFDHNTVFVGTAVIGMLIPSFFIFFFKSESKTQKIIKIITFFLLLFCVYKAETRSSLIYIFAIFLYHFRKMKFINYIISGIGIILVVFVLNSFIDLSSFLPDRFSFSYSEKTGLNDRNLIWISAMNSIIENPNGVDSPFLQVLGQKFSPHNNILTYWILFGFITGFFILYVFFAVEIYALRKVKKMHYLQFFLTLIFINFFIESMVLSAPFTFSVYALLAGFMVNNRVFIQNK